MRNIWNNIVAWAHRIDWRSIFNWLHRNIRWVAIVAAVLFLMVCYWGCSSAPSSTAPAPGGGYFFWKLLFIGLIVALVVSREKPYLAMIFSGLAVLVLIVLLGKLDGLFAWGIIGLPLFATAGFYGSYKTEGRTKAFLGFASGLIILAWMYMFAQATLKVNLDFLGDRKTD